MSKMSEEQSEDHLTKKTEKRKIVSQMIPQTKKNAKIHLTNANDNGKFHFGRIGKSDFIFC